MNVVALKQEPEETPMSIYARCFPYFTPSIYQQDVIESVITDLVRWKKAVEFWAINDYRAQSIGKMIDYYHDLDKPKVYGNPNVGKYDPLKAVEKVETACGICGEDYCLKDHRGDL